MKTPFLLLALCAVLLPLSTQAKQSGAAREKGDRSAPSQVLERRDQLKAADTDGNGSISKAEAQAAELKRLVAHFEKIDTNGDGELSKQEMGALRQRKASANCECSENRKGSKNDKGSKDGKGSKKAN